MNLAKDAAQSDILADPLFNPLALIAGARPERIEQIVRTGEDVASMHQLASAYTFQLARISETLIVASTVEALATATTAKPEYAFYKAVMRETGLNLIAWNYPTLYATAIDTLMPGQSIEELLTKGLGFSPEDLLRGLITAQEPSLHADSEAIVQKSADPSEHFHRIGRALARSEFPDLYPNTKQDWLEASRYLKLSLGAHFPGDISRRLADVAQSYCTLVPKSFGNLRTFDPERHYREKKSSNRITTNPFVKDCPTPVQVAIRELYAAMPADRPDASVLQTLLGKVIPNAGFTGGCLFLVNKRTSTLTPRTIIGEVRGREIQPVPLQDPSASSVRYREQEESGFRAQEGRDPIARAFISKRPVVEDHEQAAPSQPTESARPQIRKFFAAIGEEVPVGVLYLEKTLSGSSRLDDYALPTFRAINRSLSDALLLD